MNIKNEKGITLVALIVSIIVMIILATVTLTTTFTAYETTRAQKFKSQMRVLQEGANSFYSDWQAWVKEKELEYREFLKTKEYEISDAEKNILKEKINEIDLRNDLTLEEKNVKINEIKANFYNEHSIPEEMKLLENTDLPEYFYTQFASIDKYLEYKKDTYEYEILGKKLEDLEINTECYEEVDKKMKELLGEEYNLNENNSSINFYQFNEDDIEYFLGIRDIDIPVYINFENLVIFTTKPVRLNGQNIYTLYSFTDETEIILSDTKSTIEGASILVDVTANYGTSQKITLTLESYDVVDNENRNNYVDYRIRKAYYQNIYTEFADDSEMSLLSGNMGLLKDASWYEVDGLKECEYSEDGKSVSFIIYESGMYRFRLEDVSGAYTTEMKKNTKINIENPTNQYSYEKIEPRDINGDGKIDIEATYNITLCNAPVLNEDMIPVKWIYDDDNKVNGKWVICTTIDPEWYNYSEDSKMWANVMMVHDTTAKSLEKGTKLSEKEMGSMFVWVPRFTTKTGYYSVKFMRGTSATSTFGNYNYLSGAGDAMSCFGNNNEASWDTKLRGLWFAKYDTSLESDDNKQQINSSEATNAKEYDKLYSASQNFKPTVKPYRITWRNISFTSAFSQALMYYTNLPSASKNKDLNTHMMTESENDALEALSSNNKYGVGMDNSGTPNLSHNTTNKYAGGSDGHSGYTVANFIKQSTNGNMTGVFDFEGTTNAMITEINSANSDDDSECIYNSLGEKINEKSNHISNKYITVMNYSQSIGTIKIAEQASYVGNDYKKISDCVSPDIGFRIVIANSPSGDRSNFVYTSKNLSNTDASLPGFYITDENGNYIRNSDGEFIDENGESTYISWDEMINRNWIKIEKGNERAEYSNFYKPEDRIVVKGDNESAWRGLTGILVISDSVNIIGRSKISESISESGFNNRLNLLEVRMPDTITEIGDGAFSWCSKLKSVQLSKNIKRIGMSAFHCCESLVNISLPEALEIIDDGAFYYCEALESVTLPINVVNVGMNAFSCCFNVSNLEILSEAKDIVIEEYAFNSIKNVKNVKIPSNVKEIKPSAFSGMISLENVEFEDGVQIIGEGTFVACTSLKKIVFPKTVNTISLHTGDYNSIGECGLFEDCTNLEEVDFSKTSIEDLQNDAFQNCGNLKSVKFPPTLKRIGKEFFSECYNLKSIELPDTLEYIDRLAFGQKMPSDPVPSIQIEYKGTKTMWDSITKVPRIIPDNPYGDILYEQMGWNENINITVITADDETIIYEPRE